MNKFHWIALAFISVMTFETTVDAAEDKKEEKLDETVSAVFEKIDKSPDFKMDLHLLDEGKPVEFDFQKDSRGENAQPLHRKSETGSVDVLNLVALRHMLLFSFSGAKRTGLNLTFKFPDSQKLTLYPLGLPETAYALKLLLNEKSFKGWEQSNITAPNDACPLTVIDGEKNLEKMGILSIGSEIRLESPEAKPPLDLAKSIYDLRRAELIAKVSKSYLFYPESKEIHWPWIRKQKSSWYVYALANDRMYTALFIFQIEPSKNDELKCEKMYAVEFFKGE